MSEHGSSPSTRPPETGPTPPSETVVGLVAQFDGPELLVAAARRVREAGYRQWDTHSPFPVHGMDRAMGIRPTVLPWLVLGPAWPGPWSRSCSNGGPTGSTTRSSPAASRFGRAGQHPGDLRADRAPEQR